MNGLLLLALLQGASPACGLVDAKGEMSNRLRVLMDSAIAQSVSPGFAITVGCGDRIIVSEQAGAISYEAGAAAITDSTLWDVASLTKVVVTTAVAMIAVQNGRMSLDTPLGQMALDGWPTSGPPARLTMRRILSHRTGWPATTRIAAASLANRRRSWSEALRIATESTRDNAGERYGDVNMMVAGLIIERVLGDRLDRLWSHYVSKPLGLKDSTFRPRSGDVPLARIAPTDWMIPSRPRLQGQVHDAIAMALGEVSGNSGLFASQRDLEVFMKSMFAGANPLIAERVRGDFLSGTPTEQRHFVVGWDMPSDSSTAGDYFGPIAYGHSGWTGASLWYDTHTSLWVVLLSNRVNPDPRNARIRPFRRLVHDEVYRLAIGRSSQRREEREGVGR